jgi:hypothetical protein
MSPIRKRPAGIRTPAQDYPTTNAHLIKAGGPLDL